MWIKLIKTWPDILAEVATVYGSWDGQGWVIDFTSYNDYFYMFLKYRAESGVFHLKILDLALLERS